MTQNRRRKEESRKLGMEFFWSDAKTYYEYMDARGYVTNSLKTDIGILRALRDVENEYGITYDGVIDLNNINQEEIIDFLNHEVGYYKCQLL